MKVQLSSAPRPSFGPASGLARGIALALALVLGAPLSAQATAHAGVWSGSGGNLVQETLPSGRAAVSDFHHRDTGGGHYVNYHASAYADSERGTLGAAIQVNTLLRDLLRQAEVHTYSALGDQGMFHGPGDRGTVRLTYTVTGNFESVGPSFFRAGGQLGLAGANAEFGWSWLNELSQPQAAFFGHAHVVDLDNDPGGLRATIALSQTVETGVWYDIFSSLWLELSASRIDTALSQFGHTARLAIELPDGWTMTSRSGAFMTDVDDPAGAVPEPASALLALLALAAATATRTRRQS